LKRTREGSKYRRPRKRLIKDGEKGGVVLPDDVPSRRSLPGGEKTGGGGDSDAIGSAISIRRKGKCHGGLYKFRKRQGLGPPQ